MTFVARLVLVVSIASVALVIHWVARASHPRRLFFIHLGRELSDADRARSRRLVWVNAVVSLVSMALVFVPEPTGKLVLAASLAPLVPTAWMLGEMVGLVRSLPVERVPGRFTVPLGEQPSTTSYVSAPLQVANLVVLLATAAAFVWLLARMPDRVPLHFDLQGHANRYGSPRELWGLFSIQVFDTLLVWVVAWGMSRERWALPPDNAERYAALSRERRALIVRMIEWIIVGTNLSISITWLSIAAAARAGRMPGAGLVVSLVVAGVAMFLPLVAYLRPLLRVQDGIRELAGSEVLGTRSAGWRARGLIYFAPDDPALLVPKRRGIGQTLNFGRPAAWLILFAVIVAAPLLSFLATKLLG